MKRHRESGQVRKIPLEILQDILLRLPTRDVIRSSCVSKLWRRIVKDPSFVKLHAAGHALAPSESEALLVSVNQEPGRLDEASFFNVSCAMAMCNDVAIPTGYSLANTCNGFLCFAFNGNGQVPVVVCNPVTGETLELPKAPPLSDCSVRHRFILGFSPATQEYKMFRLSYISQVLVQVQKTNYIAVYTLGSRDGWRQYSYLSQFCPLHELTPPVYIDGYVYIVETDRTSAPAGQERATRMLVLNVETETRCIYRLPYDFYSYGYSRRRRDLVMPANGFELNGQMCLTVHVLDEVSHHKLQFWVMKSPDKHGGKDDDKLHWDLRYCFDLAGERHRNMSRGAWLDHEKMLWYLHGNFLYKHDTGGHSLSSNNGLLLFDQKLELPQAPSNHQRHCYWNICGGYRPSLLSPLTFALPPSQDEKGKKRLFEHTLLRAVRQSKKA